jgi:hypothetical protein
LNGIIGITELLAHTNLSPEQSEHVASLTSCSRALLNNINDVCAMVNFFAHVLLWFLVIVHRFAFLLVSSAHTWGQNWRDQGGGGLIECIITFWL